MYERICNFLKAMIVFNFKLFHMSDNGKFKNHRRTFARIWNARDQDGETPLDQAIEGGAAETVALLHEYAPKIHKELKMRGR